MFEEENEPGGQVAGATATVSHSAHAEVNEPSVQFAGEAATASQSAHAAQNCSLGIAFPWFVKPVSRRLGYVFHIVGLLTNLPAHCI